MADRLRAFLIACALVPAPSAAARGQTCDDAAARTFAREAGTAAYLMLADGRQVAAYGDITHNYRLHSVRKSLMSALVGIAVAQGRLSLDETLASIAISDYAPLSGREQQATLGDLLASRSGVYRPATHENRGYDAVRPERESHAPGTHWFYSNWDFNAVGSIYQIKTGRSVCSALLSEIVAPLGMRDFGVENCRWRYSARSRHPAYVFRMSARDLAAFGELMRLDGSWQGRQIVPEPWVRRSTAPISDVARPDGTPMPGVAYGLMWWTAKDGRSHFSGLEDAPDLGEGAFAAIGTGTQMLVVAPELGMTFVHFSDTDSESGRPVRQNRVGQLLKLLIRSCLR